jgi:predicted RNA-binding Zn-ribbon protein involved in translation (DUF1610 family)
VKEITWGCPECGSTDIVQHVKLTATRGGKFRSAGNGAWEFDADDEYDRDSIDVDDEGEFECEDCGEEFDKPARVRQGGIRLALRVQGEAFKPDDKGVEQEIEDDLSARFEIECADEAEAKRLFAMFRMFVGSVAGSAKVT